MSNQSSPLIPTFEGHIATTWDALILFESCLSGQLTHVPRRPHDRERPELIKSGHVFIYEEQSSGIKRWTDGVSWSPSRILGNFLIYRELDKPFPPGEKKRALKKNNKKCPQGVSKTETAPRSTNGLPAACDVSEMAKDTERSLIGSLVDSYQFKQDGLVKKTISVQIQGIPHHMVSYYSLEDVVQGRLGTPTKHSALRHVLPRAHLVQSQNFRAPLHELALTVDDRGGQMMNTVMSTHEMNASNLLQRTMSLPNVQSVQIPQYMPVSESFEYQHQLPSQQHNTIAHQMQPHPQVSHTPHQSYLEGAGVSSVSALPPSTPSLTYSSQTQGNYALDPSRHPRFDSNSTMNHDYPRHMPSQSPPRRHSTFYNGLQPNAPAMPPEHIQSGRSAPAGSFYLHQNPYYMSHRSSAVAGHAPIFSSSTGLKAETEQLAASEGESQHHGLEDNSTNWGFGTLDGGQGQQYYGA